MPGQSRVISNVPDDVLYIDPPLDRIGHSETHARAGGKRPLISSKR